MDEDVVVGVEVVVAVVVDWPVVVIGHPRNVHEVTIEISLELHSLNLNEILKR